MILNRKSIIIILLCFIFINCSNKDSMTIFPTGFVDPSDSSGGSGGSGGSGNTTELDVQLMYPLDDQTKLFSTTWGAHQRTFIVHVPPNFDSNYSIPLLFVLHGYTSSAMLFIIIQDLIKLLTRKTLLQFMCRGLQILTVPLVGMLM